MANSNGNGRGGRLALSLVWSIVLPVGSGIVAAVTAAYTMRDAVLQEMTRAIQQARVENREAYRADLSHYVTLEQFLGWRQEERVRQDAQYYALLRAINRLEDRGRR